MINKPKNWDEVDTDHRNFNAPVPGVYLCKIIAVKKAKSKSNRNMLIVMLDINDDGKFDGYFGKLEMLQIGKGWSNIKWGLSAYFVLDFDDPQFGHIFTANFKKFLLNVKSFDPDFEFDWNTGESLIGKKIAALVCIKEFLTRQGNVRQAHRVQKTYPLKKFQAGYLDTPWIENTDGERIPYANTNVNPNTREDRDHATLFDSDVDGPFV